MTNLELRKKQWDDSMSVADPNDFDCKYVAALVPDKMKLAYYIKEAKGPGRTMAEFAEACGTLSAPSFSRIVHGNLKKPLTVEVIQSIVKNAAPRADIDYDSIMRANGMVPAKSESVVRDRYADAAYREEKEVKTADINAKNIIVEELFARGHMIQMVPGISIGNFYSDDIPQSRFSFPVPASFVLRIKGMEPKYWVFKLPEGIPHENRFIKFNTALFLRDQWEPETLKDIKFHAVFTDKDDYKETIEKMKGIKVNSYFSFILVDTEKNRVVEERMLTRNDGKTMESIFDEPRIDG